ncbi:MAG: hypothetical protein Q4B12_07275 [Bowdeniella nasicola]|nr:hypothetical protein [Bowdeniella nasicola]
MSLASALFAVAVASILLYLIPRVVQRRAVLAESTADDRFSADMRLVEVVAFDSPVDDRSVRGPLLDPVSARRRREALNMKRPANVVAARITVRDLERARAGHLARIEGRAAVIRIQRVVLVGLLAIAGVSWVAGLTGVFAWGWALVPTLLTVGVIAVGVKLSSASRHADLVERRKIAAIDSRLRVLRGDVAAAKTPAKKAAVRTSAAGKSAAKTPARATNSMNAEVESAVPDRSAAEAPAAEVPVAPGADQTVGDERANAEGETAPRAARQRRDVVVAHDVPEAVVADARWEPVSIPAPTYTLKAKAPRPAIAADEDVLPRSEHLTAVPVRPTRARILNGVDTTDDAETPATPVLDIDSALARRAAGA